jgi:F-type H+-transporting ATPase subunit alpha
MNSTHAEIGAKIIEQKKLDDALEEQINKAIAEFKETFSYKKA